MHPLKPQEPSPKPPGPLWLTPQRSIQAAVLLALAQSRSRTVHYPNSSGTCTPRDKSYQIFRATPIPNKNTFKIWCLGAWKAESCWIHPPPFGDWSRRRLTLTNDQTHRKRYEKKTTKDHAQQPPSAHYCHSLLLNVGARSSFSEVVKNSAYAIHPFFSTFHISILNQVSPFFIIRPAHYTSLGGYGPGHLVQ